MNQASMPVGISGLDTGSDPIVPETAPHGHYGQIERRPSDASSSPPKMSPQMIPTQAPTPPPPGMPIFGAPQNPYSGTPPQNHMTALFGQSPIFREESLLNGWYSSSPGTPTVLGTSAPGEYFSRPWEGAEAREVRVGFEQSAEQLLDDDDDIIPPDPQQFEDMFSSLGGMELEDETRTPNPPAQPQQQAPWPTLDAGWSDPPIHSHSARILLVRNVGRDVEDEELCALFEFFGPLRSMYAQFKGRGFVIVIFNDIRHAQAALTQLQSCMVHGRHLEVHPCLPRNLKDQLSESDRDLCHGTLVVFNLDAHTTTEEVRALFSKVGEVKEVRETPHKRHHKFVEFYDIRAAEAALRMLNRFELRGKKIKVEPSRPGGNRRAGDDGGDDSPAFNTPPFGPFGSPPLHPYPRQSPPPAVGLPPHSPTLGGFDGPPPPGYFLLRNSPPGEPPPMNLPSPNLLLPQHMQQQQESGKLGAAGVPPAHRSPPLGPVPMGMRAPPQARLAGPWATPGAHLGLIGGGNGAGAGSNHQFYKAMSTSCPDSHGMAARMGSAPSANSDGGHQGNDHGDHSPWSQGHSPHQGSAQGPGSPPSLHQSPSQSQQQPLILGQGNWPGLGQSAQSQTQQGQGQGQGQGGAQAQGAQGHGGQAGGKDDAPRRRDSKDGFDKSFLVDLHAILSGADKRTTLMVKNIPNKYNQRMLLSAVDDRLGGPMYDFFYLPIDFKNKCNVGYAFINFTNPMSLPAFFEQFHGRRWEKFNSDKVCEVAYARIQGKQALITHFQNSSLMAEDKKCRPLIFHTEGSRKGEQEPFPVGPNVRRRLSGERDLRDQQRGRRDNKAGPPMNGSK
eukprot:CAMPEP_0114558788 /NCGR_PEP_ID=MMETSP0114-20121206/10573_1 /TAXON_ID=31324 /ORGANISM="Goniomonas sp, Strain m" /LENGTH=839 /DNA_ID=CAMNT_0001744211 /DNA_START=29 /DNA_END=2548 /DNA_ORIENTATION=-